MMFQTRRSLVVTLIAMTLIGASRSLLDPSSRAASVKEVSQPSSSSVVTPTSKKAAITLRAGRSFAAHPLATVPLRFGHAFARGELPGTPELLLDGNPTPRSQVRVMNRYDDGSCRYIVVAAVIERVLRGQSLTVSFRSVEPPSAPAPHPAITWPAGISPVLTFVHGEVTHIVSAKDLFDRGAYRVLDDGAALVTLELADHSAERSADVGFGEHRTLRPIFQLDLWRGTPHVRVRFAAETSCTEAMADMTYDVTASLGNGTAPAVSVRGHRHYAATRWSTTAWAGPAPVALDVLRDPEQLASTGLFPRFARGPSGKEIDAFMLKWRKAPRNLGEAGLWRPGGKSGGGHPQIAPYPEWELIGLLDGSADAIQMIDDNADLSGSWPLYYREGRAGARFIGRPVSTIDRPTLMLRDLTYGYTRADQRITLIDKPERQPWNMDRAHLPNLGIIPAYLTGDPWHLESALFVASWAQAASNGAAVSGAYGRGPRGDCGHIPGELRGQAWALLQRMHVAWLLESSDPWSEHLNALVLDALAAHEGERAERVAKDSPLAERPVYEWSRKLRPNYQLTMLKHRQPLPPGNDVSEGGAGYTHGHNGVVEGKVGLAQAPWQMHFLTYAWWRAEVMGWPAERLLAFATQNVAIHLAHPALLPSHIDSYVRPLTDPEGVWLSPEAMAAAWSIPGGPNTNAAYTAFTQPAIAAAAWALSRDYVPTFAPPCPWYSEVPKDVDVWASWNAFAKSTFIPLTWSVVP